MTDYIIPRRMQGAPWPPRLPLRRGSKTLRRPADTPCVAWLSARKHLSARLHFLATGLADYTGTRLGVWAGGGRDRHLLVQSHDPEDATSPWIAHACTTAQIAPHATELLGALSLTARCISTQYGAHRSHPAHGASQCNASLPPRMLLAQALPSTSCAMPENLAPTRNPHPMPWLARPRQGNGKKPWVHFRKRERHAEVMRAPQRCGARAPHRILSPHMPMRAIQAQPSCACLGAAEGRMCGQRCKQHARRHDQDSCNPEVNTCKQNPQSTSLETHCIKRESAHAQAPERSTHVQAGTQCWKETAWTPSAAEPINRPPTRQQNGEARMCRQSHNAGNKAPTAAGPDGTQNAGRASAPCTSAPSPSALYGCPATPNVLSSPDYNHTAANLSHSDAAGPSPTTP